MVDQDASTVVRIREAALRGFAANGVAATSIRDVAAAAGVSPGLVQHHFRNKDALREAVDKHVVEIARAALQNIADPDSDDLVQQIGDRVTAWMRDHRVSLLYIARSIADGEPSALLIFDELVRTGDDHIDRLVAANLLRPGLDLRWAVLHVLTMNLATALLKPAIDRQLTSQLDSPIELERWNRASTELFRAAFFRQEPDAAEAR